MLEAQRVKCARSKILSGMESKREGGSMPQATLTPRGQVQAGL